MFSTVTSAFFSRERTISRPRGDLRFNVSDFLLALNWWKYQGSLSGWPGRRRRPGSPVVGFSILTTSAPSQARDSVQDGPASNWVKSTTLIPSRQSSSTPISAIARSSWAAMLEYLLAARNPPDSRRAVHGKEDSPGIHRSKHPCGLGSAVALSGAVGVPEHPVDARRDLVLRQRQLEPVRLGHGGPGLERVELAPLRQQLCPQRGPDGLAFPGHRRSLGADRENALVRAALAFAHASTSLAISSSSSRNQKGHCGSPSSHSTYPHLQPSPTTAEANPGAPAQTE